MTTESTPLVESLTPREEEVLERLRRGLTNRQIARELDISADGVKFHASAILGKLGVRSRHEAAYWPERAPWWAGGLAPLMFWWRRTVPSAGGTLSSTANVIAGGVLLAAVGGLALLAFLVLRSRGSAEPVDVLLLEPQTALVHAVENTRNADSYRMTISEADNDVPGEMNQAFEFLFEQPNRYYALSREEFLGQSCSSGSMTVTGPDGTPYPQPTDEEVCEDLPADRRVVEMFMAGNEAVARSCFDIEDDCDEWQEGGPVPNDWEPVMMGLAPWHGALWPLAVAERLEQVVYEGLEVVDGVELVRYRGIGDAFGTMQDITGKALDDLGTPYGQSCHGGECTEYTFAEAQQREDFEDMSFLSFIDVFVDPATQLVRRIELLAFPWALILDAPMMVVEYSDFGNVTVELPQ